MAKRFVNYFANIKNDEEFDKFLMQKALLILDVYQDIYGPCSSSLHFIIERAKLSLLNSDVIQLAICDADKIEKLKRFRFKSKPTILFCDNQKVIDVFYYADIPLIQRTIQIHLEAHEKNIERQYYEFDQPLPFEQIELDRIKEETDEAARILKANAETELRRELDEVIELMSEYSNEYGITLFMPHTVDGAMKKTLEHSQRLLLNSCARKIVQISQGMMETLNYQLENPMDEEVMNYLYEKDLLIVMWTGDSRKPIEDQLKTFVKEVSEPPSIDEAEESDLANIQACVLEPLVVYLAENDEDSKESTDDVNSKSEDGDIRSTFQDDAKFSFYQSTPRPSTQTSVKRFSAETEEIAGESRRRELVVPPLWTPANQASNFMFMYTFFRNQFEHYLPSVKVPELPHVCMIFSASDRSEVLQICEKFPEQLLASGFFSSDDLSNCKLICKTAEKYDELEEKSVDNDKIILKVAKQTSSFELALSAVGPVYVSQNTSKGAQECSMIFTESFLEAEDFLELQEEVQTPNV